MWGRVHLLSPNGSLCSRTSVLGRTGRGRPHIGLRTRLRTRQTTYLLPAIPAAQGHRPSGPPPPPQAGFLIAREALQTPQQDLSTCPPMSEGVSNCSPPPGLHHRPPHSRASGGGRTDGAMRGHKRCPRPRPQPSRVLPQTPQSGRPRGRALRASVSRRAEKQAGCPKLRNSALQRAKEMAPEPPG